MSVDQYQRTVNNLDKEIAELEKKKAIIDKKSADEQKKAANISISKNTSASIIKSKMREVERHQGAATKAANESAALQKRIADKRIKRNEAYIKLQKEQQNEHKMEQKVQAQAMTNMQRAYEERIAELEKQNPPIISTVSVEKNEELPEYDVFISHAWEDKESFADEFVEELRNLGVKVWYDTSEIRWGDSMRQKIDEGLKNQSLELLFYLPITSQMENTGQNQSLTDCSRWKVLMVNHCCLSGITLQSNR